jgi:hypothetical protein
MTELTQNLRYNGCRSRTRRLRRVAKLFVVIVGLATGLNAVAAAGQGGHCARHGASQLHVVQPGGGHQEGHHATGAAWERPHHTDCPHCPATECARVAPCATSSSSALLPSSFELGVSLAHAVEVQPTLGALHSTSHRPQTPPPQSVA